MSYIPTVDQARELVAEFNKEPFHLQHAETVSKVMGELAKEFDPERVDYWAAVGMLHDIDFELYPEQHCVKAQEMLRDQGHRRIGDPRRHKSRLRHMHRR